MNRRTLHAKMTSGSAREFVLFVIVRGICTLLSYVIYLAVLAWQPYEVAYVASYIFGIAIAYWASATLIFKAPLNRKSALLFPLVYIGQFAIGYFLIRFGIEVLGIPEWLGLAFSIAITLPLVFIASRWIIRLK